MSRCVCVCRGVTERMVGDGAGAENRKQICRRQGGRYKRPLHHSAFDLGLARDPSQSSHSLGKGKAKGLSSDLQWQSSCDQALLSAATPTPTPPPSAEGKEGNAIAPAELLVWKLCARRPAAAATWAGRGCRGRGDGDRSGERLPEGGQSGRHRGRMLCPRARPLAPPRAARRHSR